MTAKLRVLVVEDSLTVRRRICEVLGTDPGIEIVGEAADGRAAIELCLAHRPDVITMDMVLPVMSGLAATEYIMAHAPTPILIVSSSTNRGELFKTYEALAAGAVDVLEKPDGSERGDDWERRLLSAVRLVARIKVITHPRARLAAAAVPRQAGPAPLAATATDLSAVLIGASTGGPGALVTLLSALPAGYPAPILVVIHIGEPFGRAFADWLDGQSALRVAHPHEGEPLAAARGRVILAPPDRHLLIEGGRLRLGDEPPRHSCRPSVDVLFESAARELGAGATACLLTGMGRDGATGLLAIRRAGGLTVAQDEASSVVYGMPREAVALGAAQRVLSLAEIGKLLLELGRARS